MIKQGECVTSDNKDLLYLCETSLTENDVTGKIKISNQEENM